MTHVNAYYGVVEEKRIALAAAQAEYDRAVAELEAHPDYVPEKVQEAPVKTKEVEASSIAFKKK